MRNRQTTLLTGLIVILLAVIISGCRDKDEVKGITIGSIEHKGLSREYIYYSPDGLKKGAPLVVVLHGFTSSAEKIMDYSEFNRIAEENKFAVVYPQGTEDHDSNTFWNVGYAFHSSIKTNDVDFIVYLVKYLQKNYDLSSKNTFLTGMSNGGEMCYLLGCQRPDVFKAIAPVAGVMLQSFFEECDSTHPIPIFALFGTDDKVSNFNGDPENKDGWGAYIDIPSTINFWADRVDYDQMKIDTLADIIPSDSSFIVKEYYLNSRTGNEVIFYKVIHGGHDWPGSWGNMDISATNEIWNFLKKYVT